MLKKPTTFSYIAREDQNEYLSLCHTGTDTCGPGTAKGPWVKSMFQIHYVLEGRGVYTVDSRQHRLKPGDAFLIRPDW